MTYVVTHKKLGDVLVSQNVSAHTGTVDSCELYWGAISPTLQQAGIEINHKTDI